MNKLLNTTCTWKGFWDGNFCLFTSLRITQRWLNYCNHMPEELMTAVGSGIGMIPHAPNCSIGLFMMSRLCEVLARSVVLMKVLHTSVDFLSALCPFWILKPFGSSQSQECVTIQGKWCTLLQMQPLQPERTRKLSSYISQEVVLIGKSINMKFAKPQ